MSAPAIAYPPIELISQLHRRACRVQERYQPHGLGSMPESGNLILWADIVRIMYARGDEMREAIGARGDRRERRVCG